MNNSMEQDKKLYAKSRENYNENLDDYLDRNGKFKRVVDNPVYSVINELGNTNDNEKRQRWERASALMGLNSIFSAIGGSAAALSGVKPIPLSKEPFNYAMSQIDRADNNSRDDYNRYYKSALSEAIRGERRKDVIEDRYLDGLNSVRKDDQRDNIYSSKIVSDFERQVQKDKTAMERLEYSRGVKQKSGTARKPTAAEKPQMYVKSGSGRRVPLYGDDMTKLYQIGKMYEIDKQYKTAGSESIRRREFDVLMQRAYLIYERDKKALNDDLNRDVKSSDPFTLKTK